MTLGNEDTPIEVSEIVRNTVSHISLDGAGEVSLDSGDLVDGASNVIFDQSANHVPSSIVETAGLDADTVDGFEADELRNSKNVAQLSSTNTTLDINQTNWTSIPFDVQLTLDAAYTHDASGSPETITFDESGTYRVYVSLSYDSNNNIRINPGIKFNINGTRLDTFGLTGYARDADEHNKVSNTVSRLIDVSAGDTLQVQTLAAANSGTVTMRSNESVLAIEQLSSSVSLASDADTLDGLDSTAFVKTDGSTPITSVQAINQPNENDFLKLNNTTTGDTWDLRIFGSNAFGVQQNGSNIFYANDSNQQVIFPNRVNGKNGFDAGGSSIDNSTEVNTPGGGSDSFDVYDSANGQDIARFNEGGNVEIPNGTLTVDGNIASNSSLSVDSASGEYSTLRLTEDSSNEWVIEQNPSSNELNFFDRVGTNNIKNLTLTSGNVEIPNGNLNARGDVNVTNGDVTVSNRIQLERPSDSAALTVLNMENDDTLSLGASGGIGTVDIRDGINGIDVIRSKQGGNVEIPNGDLDVSNGTINAHGGLRVDTNPASSTADILLAANANISSTSSTNHLIDDSSGTIKFGFGDTVRSGNETYALEIYGNNSSVHIPNGDLNTGDIVANKSTNYIKTGGGGGNSWHFYDNANNKTIAQFLEGGNVSIPNGNLQLDADGTKLRWGENQDFGIFYEAASDELVLEDANGVELIRQPKGGATQFLQGADIGSIESPADSFTQLVSAASTSDAASGDTVGYTLAVDNQTALEATAAADGSGGLSDGPNVTIPNGGLQVTSDKGILSEGTSENSSFVHNVTDGSNARVFEMQSAGTDEWAVINYAGQTPRRLTIYDDINDQFSLEIIAGGDIEIPNGDLLDGASNVIYDQSQNGIPAERILGTLGAFEDTDSDNVAELISDFTGIRFADDETIEFGSSGDMSQSFDSANDELRWSDETNTVDRMALDRTTGNLSIEGEITEGASL
jgi:hypothetical protein